LGRRPSVKPNLNHFFFFFFFFFFELHARHGLFLPLRVEARAQTCPRKIRFASSLSLSIFPEHISSSSLVSETFDGLFARPDRFLDLMETVIWFDHYALNRKTGLSADDEHQRISFVLCIHLGTGRGTARWKSGHFLCCSLICSALDANLYKVCWNQLLPLCFDLLYVCF
jgi:hypothetical protein